ncbi:MAG TPA: helix-turn-helix transcriptional regulator [Thermomicrobiales bacterium]|nr:helix-turn-helix transcriptional regulator [Thermomicrobiales bacterium]
MLAPLIRTTRQRRGWSQYDLAFRTGLSPGTIREIESGRVRRHKRRTLEKLAAALGLSLAELEAAAERDAAGIGGRDA